MPYTVYTREFDVVVEAGELGSILGPISPRDRQQLDAAWCELQMGLLPWTIRMRIAASEAQAEIRQAVSRESLRDTAVSLLVDHSGSMRGQRILYAAATCDVVLEFLRTLGIACEVLGFTTTAWRGGRARELWLRKGRPANPGRLNELLHIVYQGAGGAFCGIGHIKQMLRPDLTKENVDGEALEWAVDRLRQVKRSRRILLVVSDGVPVDDSTLAANDLSILSDHLKEVVAAIDAAGDIDVLGIGLEDHVAHYYPRWTNAADASELCAAVLRVLTGAFTRSTVLGESVGSSS